MNLNADIHPFPFFPSLQRQSPAFPPSSADEIGIFFTDVRPLFHRKPFSIAGGWATVLYSFFLSPSIYKKEKCRGFSHVMVTFCILESELTSALVLQFWIILFLLLLTPYFRFRFVFFCFLSKAKPLLLCSF